MRQSRGISVGNHYMIRFTYADGHDQTFGYIGSLTTDHRKLPVIDENGTLAGWFDEYVRIDFRVTTVRGIEVSEQYVLDTSPTGLERVVQVDIIRIDYNPGTPAIVETVIMTISPHALHERRLSPLAPIRLRHVETRGELRSHARFSSISSTGFSLDHQYAYQFTHDTTLVLSQEEYAHLRNAPGFVYSEAVLNYVEPIDYELPVEKAEALQRLVGFWRDSPDEITES